MIEFPFDPKDNLIVVPVEVHGKSQLITLNMAVDTGATWTIMPNKTCSIIGAVPQRRISIVTGGRVESAHLMTIPHFDAQLRIFWEYGNIYYDAMRDRTLTGIIMG
jgi:hypothetical protein